jgi:hypothetical protein
MASVSPGAVVAVQPGPEVFDMLQHCEGLINRGEWHRVAARVAERLYHEAPFLGGRGALDLVPTAGRPVVALFDDRRGETDRRLRDRQLSRARSRLRERGYREAGVAFFPPPGLPDSGVVAAVVLTAPASERAVEEVEDIVLAEAEKLKREVTPH